MQLTQKKKTSQFKQIDGVLRAIDNNATNPKHAKTEITQKCAQLNDIIPSLLGISRAVLDNVIFCHQEDSCWPLKEGSELKKRFDDFKYVLRCKPWKTLKVSIGMGLVVAGAVFPAAGAGIAVAGLVWAAVNAVMDAADEPCLGGTFEYVHARSCVVVSPLTFPLFPCVCVCLVLFLLFFLPGPGAGYVFVRTAVVQTGLALVGIPFDGSSVPAQAWGATDQTLLILGQVGGYVTCDVCPVPCIGLL